MLSPLWTRQNIKVQKSLALVPEEFATTFHIPVRNADVRLLSLYPGTAQREGLGGGGFSPPTFLQE